MAAAISCGVLGGGLVGLGTLGFDRSEVAAATCADNPTPPGPADGVGSSPSAGDGAVQTSAEDGISGTTIAPVVGPNKTDAQGLPCIAPAWTGTPNPGAAGAEQGMGESTAPAAPESAEPAEDTATDPAGGQATEPAKDPATNPAVDPATEPKATEDAAGSSTTAPADPRTYLPADTSTPHPPPAPTTTADEPPTVLADPLPTVTQIVRGISLTSPPRTATPGRTGTISRQEAISRAISWVNQRVMYSQSRWWSDANGIFRQDCSGFVAMAWRADQRINYWTGNLGRISARVASSALKPGDILLLPGQHVVLFAGWSNSAKTRFNLFEEYRTGYPARYVRDASLSYYLSRGYGAYTYEGMRDVIAIPPVRPAPAPTPTPTPAAAGPAEPAPDTPAKPAVTIELAAASRSPAPASASAGAAGQRAVGDLLAALPATEWNPDLAAAYVPEPDLATAAGDQVTPGAVADVPVEELVAAQAAIDQAESRRLAAAGLNATTLTGARSSGSGYVLAAGLGLLFLAVPLIASSRSAWTATSTCIPVPPPNDVP